MSKRICARCGIDYDEGFYSQHRVLDEHTSYVTERQKKYGGPTKNCDICKQWYRIGEYDLHAMKDEVHLANTAAGQRALQRHVALGILDARDRHVQLAVEGGQSYGEIARELGISRQRVHQIAVRNGAKSTRKRGPYTAVAKVCFIDNNAYTDWAIHRATKMHQESAKEFKERVKRFKRSPVNAGGAGL